MVYFYGVGKSDQRRTTLAFEIGCTSQVPSKVFLFTVKMLLSTQSLGFFVPGTTKITSEK